MNSFDLNTLLLALYFVTPGIVVVKAQDLTVASPERNWGAKTFALISYSAINLLLYQLLHPAINALYSLFHFSPILSVPALIASKSIDFGSVFWLSFALPGILGLATGIAPHFAWFRRCFPTIQHPQPSAWDFLFARQKRAYTLIFHLKSGEKIAGFYEEGGYASARDSGHLLERQN